jgi:hypothetical protein
MIDPARPRRRSFNAPGVAKAVEELHQVVELAHLASPIPTREVGVELEDEGWLRRDTVSGTRGLAICEGLARPQRDPPRDAGASVTVMASFVVASD